MNEHPQPEEIERIRQHMACRIAMSQEGMTENDKERWTLLAHIDWQAGRIVELEKVAGHWYLVDEYRPNEYVRGPYRLAATAAAVRIELEDRWPDKKWNLQIVRA